jgi:hypothetical protein
MLKLVSRFVLEVLPYVLTALIAAIVVPGFVLSQLHASQPSGGLSGAEHADSAFELMPDNYAGEAREQVLSSNLLHNQLLAK